MAWRTSAHRYRHDMREPAGTASGREHSTSIAAKGANWIGAPCTEIMEKENLGCYTGADRRVPSP